MSATASWTIHCDGCGDTGNPTLGNETATDARKECRIISDWSVGAPGGTDWCPECRENGTMKAGLQRHYMRRRFQR